MTGEVSLKASLYNCSLQLSEQTHTQLTVCGLSATAAATCQESPAAGLLDACAVALA